MDYRIKEKLGHLVPDSSEGTSKYLDICTWNIKKFIGTEETSELIASIMGEIQADIYVLQEIAEGSLLNVVEKLKLNNNGTYKVVYGSSGGDIRVTFMYNLETVRAKQEIQELFVEENIVVDSGLPAFPRLPLHGYFQVTHINEDPFDFELVGVHLKSQRDNSWQQRQKSAERLSEWIIKERFDEDLIITGDFNAPPEYKEWSQFHSLENAGKIKFKSYNFNSEISHLYRQSGSRLDCFIVSEYVPTVEEKSNVIKWEDFLGCGECTEFKKLIIDNISDHFPVIARFYLSDTDSF